MDVQDGERGVVREGSEKGGVRGVEDRRFRSQSRDLDFLIRAKEGIKEPKAVRQG